MQKVLLLMSMISQQRSSISTKHNLVHSLCGVLRINTKRPRKQSSSKFTWQAAASGTWFVEAADLMALLA
jgi:hypothetical protein